jgi:hypothetical protein
MAVAFDKKRTTEFVTPADQALPEAQQTKFILVPLSQDDFDEMQLKYADKPGETKPEVGAMVRLRETVRISLAGWRNFPLADGSEAKFITNGDGRPTDETLKLIAPHDLLSIFKAINLKETLEPAEAGK